MHKRNEYIFHIDVNSAYLSWEAVYKLQQGASEDLRDIPSVVGGDPKKRSGIVLAKSIPAKRYGIKTGETIFVAKQKCPELICVPPTYGLYMKCSDAFVNILKQYSHRVQRFSIDECFMDMHNLQENPIDIAHKIKKHIYEELGFTVNIGISTNKLLAKMASDLKKPYMVHTLYKDEIDQKMWPLPVGDLFMVGRATKRKLEKFGINTIGQLANTDISILKNQFKSHGQVIWNYANGIDTSQVRSSNYEEVKGLGNSTTIPYDIVDSGSAFKVLLSLCEMVSMRLRRGNHMCNVVAVSIKDSDFLSRSHQRKLYAPTDCTNEIYSIIKVLFKELWDGKPIRHIGVRLTNLQENHLYQRSFFDIEDKERARELDNTIDSIRAKYGQRSIKRASFVGTKIKGMTGGVYENYPLMTSMI